jgi:hypothetical protein
MNRLRRLWHPELFQGVHKKTDYFEGWYFKLINADKSGIYAVIPGVALGLHGEQSHAFIQVINAKSGQVQYYRFPLSDFSYEQDDFVISIGKNRFSRQGLILDLNDEALCISGELRFSEIVPFPRSLFSPGIMGPYSFVPFMECYHGIINVRHKISGQLAINGMPVNFDDGEGYLEKDYGKSFPEAWIWIQANHFETKGTSFMFSLARIPWLGRSFTGLICFLLYQGKLYRLATYNGAKVKNITIEDKKITARIANAHYNLAFSASTAEGGYLKAPKNGMMSRVIEESITAITDLTLTDQRGNVIYHGQSENCGMEISEGADILK